MPATPCATVVGEALEFGIDTDEAGLLTQSVSVTHKQDKKEARNGCGTVKALAFYNKTSEVSIEGLGTIADTFNVGTVLTLSDSYGIGLAGALYIDEVTVDKANEDWVKSSIKATAYAGIPGV